MNRNELLILGVRLILHIVHECISWSVVHPRTYRKSISTTKLSPEIYHTRRSLSDRQFVVNVWMWQTSTRPTKIPSYLHVLFCKHRQVHLWRYANHKWSVWSGTLRWVKSITSFQWCCAWICLFCIADHPYCSRNRNCLNFIKQCMNSYRVMLQCTHRTGSHTIAFPLNLRRFESYTAINPPPPFCSIALAMCIGQYVPILFWNGRSKFGIVITCTFKCIQYLNGVYSFRTVHWLQWVHQTFQGKSL